MKKNVACFLFGMVLLICTGCGVASSTSLAYNPDKEMSSVYDGLLTENDRFQLLWDSEYGRVVLKEKASGVIWSSTPPGAFEERVDEYGIPAATHPQLLSPVVVECFDINKQEIKTSSAYVDSIMGGTFSAVKATNGIEVTYYFADLEIAITVIYRLHDDKVSISVDMTKIQENTCKVTRITVAPFLCSVDNNEDGYLFVPSGSGALVYPKNIGVMPRIVSQEVYGDDANRYRNEKRKVSTTEEVRLPVFGAKSGSVAVCGIIEQGAELASIESSVGSTGIGFSGVSASFTVRGYQWVKGSGRNNSYRRLYADGKAAEVVTVGYYPLTGADADYVGMAGVYRKFLFGQSDQPDEIDSVLALDFLGGYQARDTVLGIPYNRFVTMTTLDQAQRITEEIHRDTGIKPTVRLTGFGNSGLDIGEIAGGYRVHSKLGGNKGLQSLANYCTEAGIPLFVDFDLIRFNRSGNGVSAVSDKALGFNGLSTDQYHYSIWSRDRNTNFKKYFLVSRGELSKLAQNVLDKSLGMKLSGVSLSTLSNICYSDYSDLDCFVKGSMGDDVSTILRSFSNSGIQVAVDGANAYAAAESDVIYNSPVQHAEYDVYDETVPFYQIVFRGYKPISVPALNLEVDGKKTLLKAVESGCSLSYILANEIDTTLLDSVHAELYSVQYKDWRDEITRTVKKHKGYMDAIQGAVVQEHEILSSEVRKTVFSNGITVYVNYADTAKSVGAIEIPAKDYVIRKG